MTIGDRPEGHAEPRQPGTTEPTGTADRTGTADDALTYPISPEYVKSWTPVRALCELIANALDEDRYARIG